MSKLSIVSHPALLALGVLAFSLAATLLIARQEYLLCGLYLG